MKKECRTCRKKIAFPSGFHTRGKYADGRVQYRTECKKCILAIAAAYQDKRRADGTWADYQLKRKYGVTTVEKKEMFTMQNGQCAICGKILKMTRENGKYNDCVVLDHDHKTDMVRGLLCHSCNFGIGYFGDSPDRLRSAALYLESAKQKLGTNYFDPFQKVNHRNARAKILKSMWLEAA